MVTGIDIVEQMIRVANGEQLAFRQKDIKLKGWAVEARVYAEDPSRGFLPSIGRLVRYREPAVGGSIRVDSGVYEGAEISMYYDPMIAKVIGFGANRRDAIGVLSDGLDSYLIRGVNHNLAFLSAVLRHPRFIAGHLSTGFIAEEYPQGFSAAPAGQASMRLLAAVAAIVHHQHAMRDQKISGRLHEFAPGSGGEWVVVHSGGTHQITVAETAGGYAAIEGDDSHEFVSGWRVGEPIYQGTVNGRPTSIQVERRGVGYRLSHGGIEADLKVLSPRAAMFATLMPAKRASDMSRYLLSPMPGLLVSMLVTLGQEVKAGQDLCVIEAMKMENMLRAERDGKIATFHAKSGDSLAVDQPILEFE
jgi:propionyl-CoA carboxylase alpha chain